MELSGAEDMETKKDESVGTELQRSETAAGEQAEVHGLHHHWREAWLDAQGTRQELAKVRAELPRVRLRALPLTCCADFSSVRKRLSVQSFQGGGSSLQALQRSRLRPKKSVSNFEVMREEQDKMNRDDKGQSVGA